MQPLVLVAVGRSGEAAHPDGDDATQQDDDTIVAISV